VNRVRTTVVDEIGDPDAPPGSREWAMYVRADLQNSLKQCEFNHEHVQYTLAAMNKHKGYEKLSGSNGKPFRTFEAFCVEKQPYGLGYDPAALDRIIADRKARTAQERAERATAIAGHGEVGNGRSRGSITTSTGRGADYLAGRIKRDRPDIHKRMEKGEFKSVRAAAIEAGIVKPPGPVDLLKRAWNKATPAQRKAFLLFIKQESQ
jgi:hypothetical protein